MRQGCPASRGWGAGCQAWCPLYPQANSYSQTSSSSSAPRFPPLGKKCLLVSSQFWTEGTEKHHQSGRNR